MTNNGPARPGGQSTETQHDPEEMDEKLENLTIEVAKAAKVNSTPIFIGLLIVISLFTIPTLLDSMKNQEIQAWNNEIDSTLTGEAEQVRSAFPGLLEDVKGQIVETEAILKVAKWLWNQESAEDRQQAITLLTSAQERFPDSFPISTYLENFTLALESSAGFVLPDPPPPVIPDPVTITPELVPIGLTADGATGDGAAVEKPKLSSGEETTAPAETDSGTAEPAESSPDDVGPPAPAPADGGGGR